MLLLKNVNCQDPHMRPGPELASRSCAVASRMERAIPGLRRAHFLPVGD